MYSVNNNKNEKILTYERDLAFQNLNKKSNYARQL